MSVNDLYSVGLCEVKDLSFIEINVIASGSWILLAAETQLYPP